MAKKVKLPGRVESAEVGGIVAGAGEILDDERGKVQSVINSEVDAELVRLENEKQDNITVDGVPTEGSGNPVSSGAVYTADKALSDAIEAILLLIPSAASSLNQLADKTFVRDSIDTSTATFRGTFNVVSDLHLSASATHAQIETALNALSLGADTNDYCFVQVPDSESTENIKVTERYKFNGTGWAYEYDLNNSGFTSDQWAAINSNITALLVTKLSQLPTADALAALLAGKQDNITFDDEPTAGSNNPVKSGGIYARNNEIVALINALDAAKQDKLTFDSTPINGSSNPVTSGGVYEAIYLVQVTLAGLDGRLVNAESAITVLTENVGILRTLYQALNQSDIIVGALPSTGVANMVYRVPGTSSYADWMYYDGAWVKLAEYTTLDGYLYKGIATPSSSPAASADKMFYFAMTAGTYTNFGGLAVTEGITVLKYDGANWTKEQLSYSDGIFDVTAYSGRSFASLDALLSDADINNLIPAAVRKPGMSIKFEDSSDNKYVQYRLLATTFTTGTTQWAICDDSVLIENPEWMRVITDSNKRVICGIKKTGEIEWSLGVPTPVKQYVQSKIDGLGLDNYEDIETFLGTLIEGDETLSDILTAIVENVGTLEESPEYAKVIVDKNRRVAIGIQRNGNVYFGAGIPKQIKDEYDNAIKSPMLPKYKVFTTKDMVAKPSGASGDWSGFLSLNGVDEIIINSDGLPRNRHYHYIYFYKNPQNNYTFDLSTYRPTNADIAYGTYMDITSIHARFKVPKGIHYMSFELMNPTDYVLFSYAPSTANDADAIEKLMLNSKCISDAYTPYGEPNLLIDENGICYETYWGGTIAHQDPSGGMGFAKFPLVQPEKAQFFKPFISGEIVTSLNKYLSFRDHTIYWKTPNTEIRCLTFGRARSGQYWEESTSMRYFDISLTDGTIQNFEETKWSDDSTSPVNCTTLRAKMTAAGLTPYTSTDVTICIATSHVQEYNGYKYTTISFEGECPVIIRSADDFETIEYVKGFQIQCYYESALVINGSDWYITIRKSGGITYAYSTDAGVTWSEFEDIVESTGSKPRGLVLGDKIVFSIPAQNQMFKTYTNTSEHTMDGILGGNRYGTYILIGDKNTPINEWKKEWYLTSKYGVSYGDLLLVGDNDLYYAYSCDKVHISSSQMPIGNKSHVMLTHLGNPNNINLFGDY